MQTLCKTTSCPWDEKVDEAILFLNNVLEHRSCKIQFAMMTAHRFSSFLSGEDSLAWMLKISHYTFEELSWLILCNQYYSSQSAVILLFDGTKLHTIQLASWHSLWQIFVSSLSYKDVKFNYTFVSCLQQYRFSNTTLTR